ncbi:MAG: hypothetical protein ACM3XM_09560 [Mycobacterium leprae]
MRELLLATGQEILDDTGTVIGYVAQPAHFKASRGYLARGGYLVVTRDEATGHYTGTEFDALPHPKTGKPYPAGHSGQVWTAPTLEKAVALVMAYLQESGVE